ncbi:MAG: hypothetical protein IJD17_00580 [Clostridia bacterium]|nr:hypothetical protein [Clostridia bacterium]
MKNRSLFIGILFVLGAGILFGNSGIFVNILGDRGVSEMGISVMRLCFTFLLMFLYLLFSTARLSVSKRYFFCIFC